MTSLSNGQMELALVKLLAEQMGFQVCFSVFQTEFRSQILSVKMNSCFRYSQCIGNLLAIFAVFDQCRNLNFLRSQDDIDCRETLQKRRNDITEVLIDDINVCFCSGF